MSDGMEKRLLRARYEFWDKLPLVDKSETGTANEHWTEYEEEPAIDMTMDFSAEMDAHSVDEL